mmetsp:Transcript_128601/g.222164  ORF Transcript_128601/g.222164 Transcript_128601/m.222164 type:complete len:218 (-) Transcript_128601:456-1109(-)
MLSTPLQKVRGSETLIQNRLDSILNGLGLHLEIEGVPEHHSCTEDGSQGVGDTLACNVRGRAMDRFIQSKSTLVQRGTGQQSQRARQYRSLIRQNVTKDVGGDKHVEIPRPSDQVHSKGIDQCVLYFDVRELLLHHTGDNLTPQARACQDVGLIHTGDLIASLAGQLRSHTCYTLHFHGGVQFLVRSPPTAIILHALPEVNASCQLTNEDHISAFEN